MVSVFEIGLFLYAFAGAASIGYWVIISFVPNWREKDKNTKLGYGFLVGGLFVLLVFFVSWAIQASNPRSVFLETFFWLMPSIFVLLAFVNVSRRGWVLFQQVQQEKAGFEPPQAENAFAPAPLVQPGPSDSGRVDSAEKNELAPMISEDSLVGAGKNESGQEVPEEMNEEELGGAELPAEEKKVEKAGQQERDVEEEIRKIMKGDPPQTSDEKTSQQASSGAKIPESWKKDELEKLKQELKKKLDEEKK